MRVHACGHARVHAHTAIIIIIMACRLAGACGHAAWGVGRGAGMAASAACLNLTDAFRRHACWCMPVLVPMRLPCGHLWSPDDDLRAAAPLAAMHGAHRRDARPCLQLSHYDSIDDDAVLARMDAPLPSQRFIASALAPDLDLVSLPLPIAPLGAEEVAAAAAAAAAAPLDAGQGAVGSRWRFFNATAHVLQHGPMVALLAK